MADKPIQKPGELCRKSGIYSEVGSRGGNTGREVTLDKGEKCPPTQNSGGGFKIHHETKHKK